MRNPIHSAAAVTLQSLERRQLLSGASFQEGVWSIFGGGRAEEIVITTDPQSAKRLIATVNGRLVGRVGIAELDRIEISARGGDDRITLNLTERAADIAVRVDAGDGNDMVLGGVGRETIAGGNGNDTIDGGGSSDRLLGGRGHDELFGGDGHDRIFGESGSDTLSGGWGRDRLNGGADGDQIRGGANGDLLEGRDGKDTLQGGEGRDTLIGGLAKDTVRPESTRDTVVGRGKEIVEPVGPDAVGEFERVASFEALRDRWIEQAVNSYQHILGHRSTDISFSRVFLAARNGVARFSTTAFLAQVSSGDSTNTQETGVDEADLVETDGRRIYSIAGEKLTITDAGNPSDLKIVSTMPVEGRVQGMYLDGGRLTIVSQIGGRSWAGRGGLEFGWIVDDSDQRPEPPNVLISTIDVSNPTAPSVIAENRLDGSYTSSRMIDGRLYLVLNQSTDLLMPAYRQGSDGVWGYETEAEFRARLTRQLTRDMLPRFTTTAGGRTVAGTLARPANFYASTTNDGGLTSITLIDTARAADGPIASTTLTGSVWGQVYASRDAMYFASIDSDFTKTRLTKFSLGATAVTLEAIGTIDGSVLNQFSMDEEGEYLRVASTINSGGRAPHSAVSVLDQVGDELSLIGKVDGIAPGEQIFSARFVGDEAFLVTFEQMDPLFTIDLSNPTQPEVLGELHIPGVSTYLHPIDENHLIGFGRDGQGFGAGEGLQLSLFDVTDRRNPQRIATYDFGDNGWENSMAQWDHRLFQYLPDRQIIAVPVSDSTGTRLEMVKVDLATGFSKVGEVAIPDEGALRGVRMGAAIVAVGESRLVSANLDNGATMDSVST